MADNALKTQAFKLKGRLYTLTVLALVNASWEEFAQDLSEVVSKAPRMFKNMPVILDCTALDNCELNLLAFCKVLRQETLVPVAIQSGNPALSRLAQHHGLAVLNASSSHDKPLMNDTPAPTSVVKKPIKTKLITTPVRSGQQVVSKGDLIITAAVSNGAELLADGHIHVYGTLRGRALAGINGDKTARIFCHSLEAELVSIAGYYRLSDIIAPIKKTCQIYLQDDQIQIESV